MIDFNKLKNAYDSGGFYSLQLEVGDVCYQGCTYCYMNALSNSKNQLTDDLIRHVLSDASKLGISAIEWLGGEPLIRSSIFGHMQFAKKLGLRNNLWTGGLPLQEKNVLHQAVDLCENGLISVHLSTLDPTLYEKLHSGRRAKDIETILRAVRMMIDIGYPPEQLLNSVTFTGMQPAEDMIATMDYFYNEFGVSTSINVFHTYLRPGQPEGIMQKFIPGKKEVARVYRHYSSLSGMKRIPLNCVNKQYCSATLALLNDASITPCATIRPKDAPRINGSGFAELVDKNRGYLIFDEFRHTDNQPSGCKSCRLNDVCWGCRSQSYASGNGIFGKDPGCFRT